MEIRTRISNAPVVTFACFTQTRPKFTETSLSSFTRAQREGLRYEKKVHTYLEKLLADNNRNDFEIKISPWAMYRLQGDLSSKIRFCQPDVVLISKTLDKVILVEIKYQHTNEAWKQLRLLYEPVLKFLYPSYSIACLEICRWFDPHVPFGEHYYYSEHPLSAHDNQLGVHIFHPRVRSRIKN